MTDRPIALVTGGTRGIGRAIAAALADTHHVLVGGRDAELVGRVAAALPSAEPFVVDLTDFDALGAAVARIERLDVLVHSAGMSLMAPIGELDRDRWHQILEVNLIAVAELTRLLLPALRAAGGQVVFINSGSGLATRPQQALYSASKYALVALADALREEERGAVRVTTVFPGRVATDMQAQMAEHFGKAYDPALHLRPESIAAAVAGAVRASDEAMVEAVSVRPVNTKW